MTETGTESLAGPGSNRHVFHCVFCGKAQHMISADFFYVGDFSAGVDGGDQFYFSLDVHALGNFRIDRCHARFDGAIIARAAGNEIAANSAIAATESSADLM